MTHRCLGFCLLAFLALSPSQAPAQPPPPGKYGKTLVAHYRVPLETIEKYAEFKPTARKPGESPIISSLLADTVDWSSPAFDARASANPYTIVVTVMASARSDGDAASMWQAGWKLDSGETVRTPLAGLAKSSAKAGESFMVTAAAPTSFKENRSVGVSLGFVNARNMDIASVQIDVWSGIGGTSFAEVILAYRWAIFGLLLIGLWWLWFRRR